MTAEQILKLDAAALSEAFSPLIEEKDWTIEETENQNKILFTDENGLGREFEKRELISFLFKHVKEEDIEDFNLALEREFSIL